MMSTPMGSEEGQHDGRPGTTLAQLTDLTELLERFRGSDPPPPSEADDTDPRVPHGIGVDDDR